MPIEVIMPKVDMDMTSGRIVAWHVAEGQRVRTGQPLFDIETDKAAMEVEAPGDGILRHPADEGTSIAIGQPVAWLFSEGEPVRDPSRGRPPPAVGGHVPVEETAKPEAVRPDTGPDRGEHGIRATPLARSLARNTGLDIGRMTGTGHRGRVQASDVRLALKSEHPSARTGVNPESDGIALTRSPGGTGTPVVLIHGLAGNSRSWSAVEDHLRHRPLIRIDLPGHGRSPGRRITGFSSLVADMRRTLDELKLEKAHLVGHSLGGALALALADTRPRSIAGVTLIAPAGLGPGICGEALSGIVNASRTESLWPWLRTLVADETLITESYVRSIMAERADADLRATQRSMMDALFPDGVQSFDLRAALERVDAPTRIIWGKRDRIIPWQHALGAPGKAGLHLFGGIGHLPHIEAPEEVGRLIGSQL